MELNEDLFARYMNDPEFKEDEVYLFGDLPREMMAIG
jgi:hypothetical protein